MSDFVRINQPRVAKILSTLDQVRKSARSQRPDPVEIAELLDPVHLELMALAGHKTAPKASDPTDDPGPVLPILEAPHFHRISAFVAQLPAGHIPSYMTYLMCRLCDMAGQRHDSGEEERPKPPRPG